MSSILDDPYEEEFDLIEKEEQEEQDDVEDEIAKKNFSEFHEALLDDSVKQYLHEIGKARLLTRAEEISLAKRMDIEKYTRILEDKWKEEGVEIPAALYKRFAFLRVQADAEGARKQFIETNLRLVVSVAKKYLGHGLDILDMIQDGNLGLMTAVQRFNHERGYKFSTYATWWIRQAITRGIADKGRTIRIPVHAYGQFSKLKKAYDQLTAEQGRQATSEEIAGLMGVSLEKIEEMRRLRQDVMSLDAFRPVDGNPDSEDSVCLADFLEDRSPTPEEIAIRKLLQGDVKRIAQAALTEREYRIIELRYGLEDGIQKTLEQVGEIFGITRERIRQIEVKAFKKLRHPSSARKLRTYL